MVPAVTGEDSGALCSALGDGLGLAGLQVTSVPWIPIILKWGKWWSIKSPSLTTFEPYCTQLMMFDDLFTKFEGLNRDAFIQVATGSFGGILCASDLLLKHSETF